MMFECAWCGGWSGTTDGMQEVYAECHTCEREICQSCWEEQVRNGPNWYENKFTDLLVCPDCVVKQGLASHPDMRIAT